MIERRNWIAALVVLGVSIVINLYAGITVGLREDWMRMALYLFTGVFFVFVVTTSLLAVRLNNRLTRLEDRFQIDRELLPRGIRRISTAVGVFMVLSIPTHMILSVVAGFRANWFRFGTHLAACAITAIIGMEVLAMMSLSERLARLERLSGGTGKAEV